MRTLITYLPRIWCSVARRRPLWAFALPFLSNSLDTAGSWSSVIRRNPTPPCGLSLGTFIKSPRREARQNARALCPRSLVSCRLIDYCVEAKKNSFCTRKCQEKCLCRFPCADPCADILRISERRHLSQSPCACPCACLVHSLCTFF